jgi:hypothetical protein
MHSVSSCGIRFLLLAAVSGMLLPNTVTAQDLNLVGVIVKAMQEASATIDDMDSLHTALTDFELGKNPHSSGDWSTLGDRFESSAKSIRGAPLPDLQLDKSPLIYPKTNCSNDLIDRSQAYLQHLLQIQGHGSASLQTIDDQLGRVSRARESIKQIAELYKKASAIPEFGSRFSLDWVDLETSVPSGLADYQSALQERRKLIAQQMDGLSARIANLQSNLRLMQAPCDEEARKRAEATAEAEARAANERSKKPAPTPVPLPPQMPGCLNGQWEEKKGSAVLNPREFWTLTISGDTLNADVKSSNGYLRKFSFRRSGSGWTGFTNLGRGTLTPVSCSQINTDWGDWLTR